MKNGRPRIAGASQIAGSFALNCWRAAAPSCGGVHVHVNMCMDTCQCTQHAKRWPVNGVRARTWRRCPRLPTAAAAADMICGREDTETDTDDRILEILERHGQSWGGMVCVWRDFVCVCASMCVCMCPIYSTHSIEWTRKTYSTLFSAKFGHFSNPFRAVRRPCTINVRNEPVQEMVCVVKRETPRVEVETLWVST